MFSMEMLHNLVQTALKLDEPTKVFGPVSAEFETVETGFRREHQKESRTQSQQAEGTEISKPPTFEDKVPWTNTALKKESDQDANHRK